MSHESNTGHCINSTGYDAVFAISTLQKVTFLQYLESFLLKNLQDIEFFHRLLGDCRTRLTILQKQMITLIANGMMPSIILHSLLLEP